MSPRLGCKMASSTGMTPFGCFIVASLPVGQLERAVFWHVETFASQAAAEKAKSARGVVVEAFDKVWLLTIADAGWRSQGGTHRDGLRGAQSVGSYPPRFHATGHDAGLGLDAQGTLQMMNG